MFGDHLFGDQFCSATIYRISKFLKKKRYPVHDSDAVVKNIYSNPKPGFLKYLKSINLSDSIKGKKVSKNKIREEIFNNQIKKRKDDYYFETTCTSIVPVRIRTNILVLYYSYICTVQIL